MVKNNGANIRIIILKCNYFDAFFVFLHQK